jgi:hypothetical protein
LSETRLPTIPDFDATDLSSVATAVRAMKLALEILGGMRQTESTGAPMVYVQRSMPDPARNKLLRRGDFWIDDARIFRYWDGVQWVSLSYLPE